MTKPYRHWKVLPHGKLSEVDDGILTVVGPIRMPLGSFPRRMTVAGTRDREAALIARTPNGTTLMLNDLVGNIRHASGIAGWLLGLAGFAGKSARIPRVVKLNLVKDAKALRAQLLQWAEIESL